MRLNDETRFPHPVLEDGSSDYSSGAFEVDFEISEFPSTGRVKINYETKLSQPDLAAVVEDDRASIILFIECLRTYHNQYQTIQIGKGEIAFDEGELRDLVRLRPYVVANQDIDSFYSESLHKEFSGTAWSFQRSDVLAVAPEATIDVGLEKLMAMESIFNLSISDDLPDGKTQVKLDEPKITIIASKLTVEGLNRLRTSSFGKVALLNGVYLPVLMQVLDTLKTEGDIFQEYRWHHVFTATCTHLNIDWTNPDLLDDAQTLFKSPLGRFLEAKELQL